MRTISIEELQNYKDELGDNDFETSFFYYQEERLPLSTEISKKIEGLPHEAEGRNKPIMMNMDAAQKILYKGASVAGGLSHFFLRSIATIAKKLK